MGERRSRLGVNVSGRLGRAAQKKPKEGKESDSSGKKKQEKNSVDYVGVVVISR